MLDKLSKANFENLKGDTFHICFEPLNPVETELVEVSESDRPQPKDVKGLAERKPFSLLFKCPKDKVNPVQGIFKVEHEKGKAETMEVFLVPVIGPDNDNIYYQAIFN